MMSASRYERPGLVHALAAALLLAGAAMLSGCSSTIDHIPTAIGGLPEGVPQRPATPAAYPAVHDMPPTRTDETLSDAEKKKLREDLAKMRDSAARDATTAISADPTGSTAGAAGKP
jgi:hypothetical protein